MVLKRKIYNKLLSWKNECKGTKAIMVEGARRIGESKIVEEFAGREYESYILIDSDRNPPYHTFRITPFVVLIS